MADERAASVELRAELDTLQSRIAEIERVRNGNTSANEEAAILRAEIEAQRSRIAELERERDAQEAALARANEAAAAVRVKIQMQQARIAEIERLGASVISRQDDQVRRILEAGLFDEHWYLLTNPDVAASGTHPVLHYLAFGAREGRDPHPLFDSDWYLSNNPDVAQAGLNPLSHYISSGAAGDRQPRPANRFSARCDVLEIPYEIWRSPPPLAGRDVCLFVTYSAHGDIWDHVLHYLDSLVAEHLTVILIIANDGIDRALSPGLDSIHGVLLRANHGWDFAAWAAALAIFPDVWDARTLILANDSVYGPTSSTEFGAVIQRIRSSTSAVLALTDSHEIRHHTQSYFTALNAPALSAPAVRRFWATVKSLQDKRPVISAYELPLLEYLQTHDLHVEVLFPTERDGKRSLPLNPTIADWSELIDHGFPFVKVEVIRHNLQSSNPACWENKIANSQLVQHIRSHLAAIGAAPPRG